VRAEEVRDEAREIEFEIKRLPSGHFRATLHLFRRGRWWPPETRLCMSEREAMIWINSQLALRGFEDAYEIGKESRKATGRGWG
jgi:hypothetical protein